LPIAEASKVENFRTFFKAKILSQLDILDTIEKIEFQLDSTGSFQGYYFRIYLQFMFKEAFNRRCFELITLYLNSIAILKFDNAKSATAGLAKLHGLKFAKYELSAYSLYSF